MDETVVRRQGLPNALLVTAIVVVAVAIIFSIVLRQKERFKPVLEGSVAPDFTLPDLKGRMVSLSDYKGKVIFLNFWATWCKPCREEMPSMEVIYNNLNGQNFEILAVSLDKDAGVAERFTRELGLTFPILHDKRGRIKELYKTTGVPETFIIDQDGIIREKVIGPRDWRDPESTRVILDLLKVKGEG